MFSITHRSNSTSSTSVKSLATLVETDLDLTETKESTFEPTYQALPYLPPKTNFVNHLLEMFCVRWLNISKGGSQIDNNPSTWPSPWILPVHVVSNRQDKDRHPITKIAKCTIDTGNMQGNIVSRDFVENVLEFPSTSFEKLTGEEEMGGTSITGDLHTPLGAIYLTWYHTSSTRVFRDMRFLISPAPYCDMIIGAQSIQKDKILSVPCLMERAGQYAVRDPVKLAPQERKQLSLVRACVNTTKNNKIVKKKQGDPDDIVDRLKKELEVVDWAIQLHKIAHGPPPLPKLTKEELWEKIEEDYPKISEELNVQLKHMSILEFLRKDLGYHDTSNPWKEPPPPNSGGWWSGTIFSEVNNKQ